jgi:hypothetical protein
VVPKYEVNDWSNGMTVFAVDRTVNGKRDVRFYTIVPDLRDPKNPGIAWATIDPHVRAQGTYAFVPQMSFLETWPDMIQERSRLEKQKAERKRAADLEAQRKFAEETAARNKKQLELYSGGLLK